MHIMETLLGHYKVLDLADEKGVVCGKTLADYGADVIKIEKPAGDESRSIGPFFHDIPDPEKSLFWFANNTNKRSITLDIETVDGREILKQMVKLADFLIESFKPGYLSRLGLGYGTLRKLNPRLVMTSITPFGQTGPYRNYLASDIVCMAMGGLMYICGDEDRPPVRITSEQVRCQAGIHAAWASLMAHYYQQRTGKGQHVDISMQECILWTTNFLWQDWHYSKRLFRRTGNRTTRGGGSFLFVFPCLDGFVAYRVGFGSNLGQAQARFVTMLQSEGVASDMKDVPFEKMDMWTASESEVRRWELATIDYFKKHTKAELLNKALKWDFMCIPVNTPKDVAEDPQLSYRDWWVPVFHPELGTTIRYPGTPFQVAGLPKAHVRRAPLIGEHNDEIYREELGLTTEELITLKKKTVI